MEYFIVTGICLIIGYFLGAVQYSFKHRSDYADGYKEGVVDTLKDLKEDKN